MTPIIILCLYSPGIGILILYITNLRGAYMRYARKYGNYKFDMNSSWEKKCHGLLYKYCLVEIIV